MIFMPQQLEIEFESEIVSRVEEKRGEYHNLKKKKKISTRPLQSIIIAIFL